MTEVRKLMTLATVAACLAVYGAGRAWAARQAQADVPQQVCNYIETAFRATGAAYSGFEIHDWTTLSDTFRPESALRATASRLAAELGGRHLHYYGHVDSRDHVALFTGTYGTRSHLSVELASLRLVPAQTVLVVRIWRQEATGGAARVFSRLPAMYADVQRAVRSIGGRPTVNASLFGHIDRLLAPAQRSRTVDAAFGAVAALPLQPMVLPYTTSVAGFAAAGIPYIVGGTQRLDLQVALHEDHFNHYTRVLVGSPILTVEY